ncbi:integrase [Alteromonas australica]|uniref:tyrosine-type recombinase/integrase n=1 Tax=Alteromonas australica TaxID=589873 RepID=UPI0005C40A36|nr:tyrosine-type recombinase/integrase [Alteromonas australica]AJP43624.1 integrase [Alteromonas australica]MAF69751.1 integrase [Alteromonas sp.]HBF71827.1 integrase [Alteromonas australica]|tara:strand:+ start:232 stop:1602 length:1371 start_codon:yes stop_codon:yes gene_type:complete
MAKSSDTSITKAEANKFLKEAAPGKQLSCQKIKGFYLLKTQKNATWQFRYTDFAGSRKKLNLGKFVDGSDDRIEAVASVIEFKSKLNKGEDPAEEIRRKKQSYIVNNKDKERRTGASYLSGPYSIHQGRKKDGGKHTLKMIERGFTDLLKKPMDELTKHDIHEWQSLYAKGRTNPSTGELIPRSYETVTRVYGAFKTMVRHAYGNDVIDCFPLADVKLLAMSDFEKEKLHGAEDKNRRMLTDSEITALNLGLEKYKLELVNGRERSICHGKPHLPSFKNITYPNWFFPFFHLAAYTGMRPGDLYNLHWHQLNLDFKRLVKIPNKTRHHKNPARIDLPLSEHILSVMKYWKEQQGNPPAANLVFPSPRTGKELSKDAHKKHWRNLLEHSQIEYQLDFYSLRHHYISKLVATGVPLFSVARLSGHKSVKMIEEHYGHLSPHHAAEALERISDDFRVGA